MLADDVRTMREDAGLSLARLAQVSSVSKSHLHDIESGRVDATHEVVARIAAVLGGQLSVRLYPGTGPLVRDHVQAAMTGALIALLHERWRPRPEVPVYKPVRGVIDLVLDDVPAGVTVACEAQSELRRLEQQVRWSRAKAEALGMATEATVSRLLLLRSCVRMRAIVNEYAPLLAAAYPARAADVYAALRTDAPWPGDGILWCRYEDARAHVLERPPRGTAFGR